MLISRPAWMTSFAATTDRAQLPVREIALHAGKLIYMAVPAMVTPEAFYALDLRRV